MEDGLVLYDVSSDAGYFARITYKDFVKQINACGSLTTTALPEEVLLTLVPAGERDKCGHPYEATCELCYFLNSGCENLESCLKLCGYGTDGYFKVEGE